MAGSIIYKELLYNGASILVESKRIIRILVQSFKVYNFLEKLFNLFKYRVLCLQDGTMSQVCVMMKWGQKYQTTL
jgi:hypothetical protein